MKMNITTIIKAAINCRTMSVAMHFVLIAVSCIICLLTVSVSAYPEIPSKGKHSHANDKSHTSLEDLDMPRFAEPVANVTVSLGRDALLACVVENLKNYKVAWVRVDTQTILSIHHNVIIQNNRISLTYNDHRSWYLHIKEVDESDRGWYMCQVNTDPMRSRKGYLQVVVPPMIVEGLTSHDVVAREGLNVTLTCKAKGYPEPYVMWRREDGEEMLIGGEHVNVVDGEHLHITKVSRLHMAAYLCVASNGVPPSISKRVNLRVQFPPMLSIPNQLEGAYIGQDVTLECHTEAYPASINYWTTERGDMIISDTSRAGDKYETASIVNGYMKHMKLKIRNVGPNDFGTYRCVAKNSLGETDGNIKLDEMPAPTTAILSEMAMLNRSFVDGKRRNKNKLDSNSVPDYGVEEWRDGAGNSGDNNQSPMRNPPDAFHNSAGTLAQHNPLARIIQAIKTQSCGIFKRLTNLIQTIKEATSIVGDAKAMEAATPNVKLSQAVLATRLLMMVATVDKFSTIARTWLQRSIARRSQASGEMVTSIKHQVHHHEDVQGIQKDLIHSLWCTRSDCAAFVAELCQCCSIKSTLPLHSSCCEHCRGLQESHEHHESHYAQQQETMRKNLIMANELKMFHDNEMSPETYVKNRGATGKSLCQETDNTIIERKANKCLRKGDKDVAGAGATMRPKVIITQGSETKDSMVHLLPPITWTILNMVFNLKFCKEIHYWSTRKTKSFRIQNSPWKCEGNSSHPLHVGKCTSISMIMDIIQSHSKFKFLTLGVIFLLLWSPTSCLPLLGLWTWRTMWSFLSSSDSPNSQLSSSCYNTTFTATISFNSR
ncbi:dpr-interacting protein kappa [Haematobia irritans]|uniref:dpr-interacting protein kappa n=1 Tax=Haematobia irritans TaxID=7368 RepID=UPI003F50C7DE